MASTWCNLQKSIPLFAIVATFSVMVAHFSGYGIFSVSITCFLLILSPFMISINSKQSRGKYIEGEVVLSQICDEQQDSPPLDNVCKTTVHQEVPGGRDEHCSSEESENPSHAEKKFETDQTISQEKGLHHNELGRNDLFSESDSVENSFSSEDSDHDSYNFGQSQECSDDSIFDDESLFEIAIPSGHYVCPKEAAEPKFTHLQQKFQNYSTETVLDQHGIIMWDQIAKINDMNEEDNLIEIDLSMGSIKCSRFEIEA